MAVPSEICFKRVPEGWVYRAPNPWLFGGAKHYLVNDAQKGAILGVLEKSRRALIAGIFILVAAGSSIAFAWMVHQDKRGVLDFLILLALVGAGTLIAFVSAAAWQLRQLRPLLAQLPTAQERITTTELRQSIIAAMSPRRWAILGIVDAVFSLCALGLLVEMWFEHGPLNRAMALAAGAVVLGAASSAYSFAVARLRARDEMGTPVGRRFASSYSVAQLLRAAAVISLSIGSVMSTAEHRAHMEDVRAKLGAIRVQIDALERETKTKPADAAEAQRRRERLDALSRELKSLRIEQR